MQIVSCSLYVLHCNSTRFCLTTNKCSQTFKFTYLFDSSLSSIANTMTILTLVICYHNTNLTYYSAVNIYAITLADCQRTISDLEALSQNTEHFPSVFFPFLSSTLTRYKSDKTRYDNKSGSFSLLFESLINAAVISSEVKLSS